MQLQITIPQSVNALFSLI